ncbi:hypothetical protein ABZ815_20885 [Nonomuraea sp. NPDC047529]|uniref:hypothetical protein n=1 Tax=Nonomuraea sp. NPDC047529 TaxID=3155623 RepID=UPI0033E46A9F
MNQPVVLLVHGAFAESAGWNRVIQRLRGHQLTTVAVANPLRFMAERADSRGTREVAGASHALAASRPDAVTATILDAADRVRG